MRKDGNKGPPISRKKGWVLFGLGILVGLLILLGPAAIATLEDPYQIGPGVEIEEGEGGPTILVEETVEPTASDQHPSDGVIDLSPGARFESDVDTHAEVSGWDDTYLNLNNLDVEGGQLDVTQSGQTVGIEGDLESAEIRDDYSPGDLALVVENSGEATITMDNPGTNEDYVVLVDDDTDEVVGFAEPSDSTLTATVTETGTSELVLEERSLSISNPDPSDEESVSTSPVDLSVDVDFPADAEPTEVTFYNASDDSKIDNETLSSSGTASVEWGDLVGGENSWYAVAEDDVGNSEEIGNTTVYLPDELEVRNETSPDDLVDDVDVTLEFFVEDGEKSYTRTASDGVINMEDLPVDEEFIAIASADGYEDRRIYVDSIVESQEIYLLPDTADSADIVFELQDFSGNFPQDDSVLKVQRSLNGDWETVEGDFFGASGEFEARLKTQQRHRLMIKNTATGEEKVLGAFTPERDTRQTLEIKSDGEVDVLEPVEQINFKPALGSIPASDEATVTVEIEEGEEALEEWQVVLEHVTDDGDRTELERESGSGEKTVEMTVDLEDKSGELQARVDYETENGEEIATDKRWKIREHFDDGIGLLGSLTSLTNAFGDDSEGHTTLLSFALTVLITVVVAAKTRASTEVSGFAAVGSLTAFWTVGWLPASVLFIAMVAFGAAAALRRGI